MYLIETDLTYSLALDPKRQALAAQIFSAATTGKIQLCISTLCLQEIDLLLKTRQIKTQVANQEIIRLLIEAFEKYGVPECPTLAKDTLQSIRLREKYGLTFYDSYYAAQAQRLGATLLSLDRAYSRVKEIQYKDPQELAKQLSEQ